MHYCVLTPWWSGTLARLHTALQMDLTWKLVKTALMLSYTSRSYINTCFSASSCSRSRSPQCPLIFHRSTAKCYSLLASLVGRWGRTSHSLVKYLATPTPTKFRQTAHAIERLPRPQTTPSGDETNSDWHPVPKYWKVHCLSHVYYRLLMYI